MPHLAAPRETIGEADNSALKPTTGRIYSNVIFEEVDNDRSRQPRYRVRNLKHVDYPRDPDAYRPPNMAIKSKQKPSEVTGSKSLSSAFEYIISPVRYIASAFSYRAPPIPEPSPVNVEPKQAITATNVPPPQVNTKKKVTDHVSLPASKPLKTTETVSKAERITPRSGNASLHLERGPTHIKSKVFSKSRSTFQSSHAKDTHIPQKLAKNKKTQAPKKSVSAQLKGNQSKGNTSVSNKKYTAVTKTQPLSSTSTVRLRNNLSITQSNHMSYRVSSKEDPLDSGDMDTLAAFDNSPSLMSNNSSRCQSSPIGRNLREEMLLPEVSLHRFPTHSLNMCSNTMSESWDAAESYSSKSYKSAFDHHRSESLESPLFLQSSSVFEYDVYENGLHSLELASSIQKPLKYQEEPQQVQQQSLELAKPVDIDQPKKQPQPMLDNSESDEDVESAHALELQLEGDTQQQEMKPDIVLEFDTPQFPCPQDVPRERPVPDEPPEPILSPSMLPNYLDKSQSRNDDQRVPTPPVFPSEHEKSKFVKSNLPEFVRTPPAQIRLGPADNTGGNNASLSESNPPKANITYRRRKNLALVDLPQLIISPSDMATLKKFSPRRFTVQNEPAKQTTQPPNEIAAPEKTQLPKKLLFRASSTSSQLPDSDKVIIIRITSPPVNRPSMVATPHPPSREQQEKYPIPAPPTVNQLTVSKTENLSTVSSKENVPKASSKGNVAKVSSKTNEAIVYSKESVAKVSHKSNVVKVSSASNVAKVSSKSNVAKVSSKSNVAKVSSKPDVARVSTKGNVTKVSSKGNVTKVSSKGNVTKVSSKGNVTKVSSKGNVTKVSSKGNVTKVSSKTNVTRKEIVANGFTRETGANLASKQSGGNVSNKGHVARVTSKRESGKTSPAKSFVTMPSQFKPQKENNSTKFDSEVYGQVSKKQSENIVWISKTATPPTAKTQIKLPTSPVTSIAPTISVSTVPPILSSSSSEPASSMLKDPFVESIIVDGVTMNDIFQQSILRSADLESSRLDPKSRASSNITLYPPKIKEEKDSYNPISTTPSNPKLAQEKKTDKASKKKIAIYEQTKNNIVSRDENQAKNQENGFTFDPEEEDNDTVLRYFTPSATFHGEFP